MLPVSVSRAFRATPQFLTQVRSYGPAPSSSTKQGGMIERVLKQAGLVNEHRDNLTIPHPSARTDFPAARAPAKPVQKSTLSNGLRVVSQDNTSPITSLGVFIDAGCRYELPLVGTWNFIERMAFKGTEHLSGVALVRETANIGGNVTSTTGREHMAYTAEVLRHNANFATEVLTDIVFRSRYEQADIDELSTLFHTEFEEKRIVEHDLMENIHAAAYSNRALGIPLFPTRDSVGQFTTNYLRDVTRSFYVPNRMVFAATGLEHEEAVEIANTFFGEIPSGNPIHREPAKYTGGQTRFHSPAPTDGLTHIALAFETASWSHPDVVPLCVLQTLLGGGNAFSAGGPGKGMRSRLYLRVLCQHSSWAQSASSFTSIASDSSLFGVYGSAAPDHAPKMLDVLIAELRDSSRVSGEELSRAKRQLQTQILTYLESRHAKLEDIGRQVLMFNKIDSADDVFQKIEQVTANDIARVAEKMLKTPITLYAKGDLSHLPTYDAIAARFK